MEIGGGCEKCACSDNIDLRDPLSCDQSTGECLRCINHAAGDHCERCMEWYYGDAIHRKDCQRMNNFNQILSSICHVEEYVLCINCKLLNLSRRTHSYCNVSFCTIY